MAKKVFFTATLTGFKLKFFVSGLVVAMELFGNASKYEVPCTEVDFALELNISNQNVHYNRLGGRLYLEAHEILYFEN